MKYTKIILLSFVILNIIFALPIYAIQIPLNAQAGSLIQYNNNDYKVLEGKMIGSKTIDYDIKENDVITYNDKNSVAHVYSKFDRKHEIKGKILKYLYNEIPVFPKEDEHYVFKDKINK